MNMMDMLRNAQGGQGIENLARQFGLGRAETEQVLQSVLPAMSAGFKQRAQDPQGIEALLRKLQGSDYEDVYEDASTLERTEAVQERGNRILGEIFGSKDVSRAVAQKAEFTSGIGSTLVKAMLPVIASMVLGGMQRKTTQDSGMGGILDTLIRGAGQSRSRGGGGLEDILGSILGGGGARSQPRSGGGLGDILGGILGGNRSQPQRRGGGLGDILGGMLGGGRSASPRSSRPQGGGLDDLLGGVLGMNPRQRRSTGDRNIDNVIGMFDANGDGEVDYDILRQLQRRR